MSTVASICPACGSETLSASLPGHCPKCLFREALESAETAPLPRGEERLRLGDYELLEQLGRGGMGAVYRARQISLGREVAVKMVLPAHAARPEALKRFGIEAEAAAKLHHPNIVPIHEIRREGADCYFSMGLIEGGNLSDCIDKFRLPGAKALGSDAAARQEQEKIARLIVKIAAAVDYAHERGVLHRDLKPRNILIDAKGEPFLTDFGLAKIIDAEESLTDSNQFLGTLNYMSPEQALGKPISRGSDVFSLGAILYELLTQKLPFRGASPAETLRQLTEQEPLDPRMVNARIDPELAIVTLKCLAKNPHERYATAGDLQRELERWLRREPVEARRPTLWLRARRWTERNRVVTALMVALAGGLATALVFLFTTLHERAGRLWATNVLLSQVNGMIWSPKTFVDIPSEGLALLRGGRSRAAPAKHHRFTLGVSVHDNPASTTEQYSRLVEYLESAMSKTIGYPVRFSLRLYREANFEVPPEEFADFVRLNPVAYVEARRRTKGILRPVSTPVNAEFGCVIVAAADTGIAELSGLRGFRLIFGEERSTVSYLAKALLVKDGVQATNLAACAFIEAPSAAEFVQGGYLSWNGSAQAMVRRGKFDAAVAIERQYLHDQNSSEFRILKRFSCPDHFWTAKASVSAAQAQAFQAAMRDLKDSTVLSRLPDNPIQPKGFVDASEETYVFLERDAEFAEAFKAGAEGRIRLITRKEQYEK